jgi:peptide/nickel transport system permease protein
VVETRISFVYLAKRLVVSVFVLWAILTLLFLLLKAMPGDISTQLLNPNLGAEELQNVRARYGLDEPLYVQYWRWVTGYLVLDFGYSMQSPEPVISIIVERLPRTLVLFGSTFLITYTVGTLAGVFLGWKRGSTADQAGFVSGLTLYSIPFFWIAWMLILVFSSNAWGFTWFPSAHMTTPFQSEFGALELVVAVLHHMFLPAATLVAVGWAGAMLVMRTSMQEVVDAPYIQTARAKGLAPSTIKYKHAARNALIPVATQAIVGIAFIIDGSVIVESVFSWPGMGKLLVDAILNRNFPVAFAAFMMLAVLIVVMRLLTDVVYTYLDPRIKFGESQ